MARPSAADRGLSNVHAKIRIIPPALASRASEAGARGGLARPIPRSLPMTPPPGPAKTADELRAAILERYDGLSKRLQQIARHILDQPHEFGIDTLAELAARSGTQPSTIVRFAKSFGFDGASSM